MTWFKVDDSFCDHPKVEDLLDGDYAAQAIALWTLAGSWCAKQLTDGAISAAKVRRLGVSDAESAAAELVRVGLWEREGDGYRFRDWAEYQPTRESVVQERERKARNMRNSRGKSPTCDRVAGHIDGHEPGNMPASFHGPSRPDPTRPNDAGEAASAAADVSETRTEEPVSSFGKRLVWLRAEWARRYLAAFAMDAAGNSDAQLREAVRVIGSTVESDDAFTETASRVLEAYFADEYLRRHPRVASAKNFLDRLNGLIAALRQVQADSDPPDYDPARHGQPKSTKNWPAWQAHLRSMRAA